MPARTRRAVRQIPISPQQTPEYLFWPRHRHSSSGHADIPSALSDRKHPSNHGENPNTAPTSSCCHAMYYPLPRTSILNYLLRIVHGTSTTNFSPSPLLINNDIPSYPNNRAETGCLAMLGNLPTHTVPEMVQKENAYCLDRERERGK
jgi:hypothetical protein